MVARLSNTQISQRLACGAMFRLACCACVAAAVGCRSVDNAQVDLLERELRQQEDYIYELEDYLIEYSEKLRQYRMQAQSQPAAATTNKTSAAKTKQPELIVDPPRKPRTPQRMVAPPAAAPRAAGAPAARGAEAEAMEAPLEEASERPPLDPTEIEPSELEIGPTSSDELPWQKSEKVAATPVAVRSSAGAEAAEAHGEAPAFVAEELPEPMPIPEPADEEGTTPAPVDAESAPEQGEELSEPELELNSAVPALPPLPAISDAQRRLATRLHVRRLYAEQAEEGEAAGSLLTVVEAVNAIDEPVDAAGAAELMVMAPDETGVMQRVERWNFSPDETAASWQSSKLGDGLHLQLPLGATPLPTGPLELWARIVRDDGAKVLTKVPFTFQAAELAALDDEALEGGAETSVAGADRSPEPAAQDAPGGDVATAAAATQDAGATSPPATQWQRSDRLSSLKVRGADTTAGGWTARGGIVPAAKTDAAAPSTQRPAASAAARWKQSGTTGRAETSTARNPHAAAQPARQQ